MSEQLHPQATPLVNEPAPQVNAKPVDVVIVGGGLVGATMAYGLAQYCPQLSIVVLEAGGWSAPNASANATATQQHPTQPSKHASFDERVLALAKGSVDILQHLGLWPEMANFGQAINDIHVSDRGHFGKVYLSAEHSHVPALGYVVPVKAMGEVLKAALQRCSNVQYLEFAAPTAIQQQAEQVLVSTAKGQFAAKLLVAADGGHSGVRQQLNIGANTTAYAQTAIITTLGLARGEQHHGVAFERFTEHGPIALLPMTGSRYSLVWTVPPEQQAQIMALSDADFLARLQREFGYRAGQWQQVGVRAAYPLQLIEVERLTCHRAVLLGNAAHTIHPIAGQGFNLGLRDVAVLLRIIHQALSRANADTETAATATAETLASTTDIGQFALLWQYSQQRHSDHQRVISLTDGLVQLFSTSNKAMALGRNLGLQLLQQSSYLKQQAARQAMGLNAGVKLP